MVNNIVPGGNFLGYYDPGYKALEAPLQHKILQHLYAGKSENSGEESVFKKQQYLNDISVPTQTPDELLAPFGKEMQARKQALEKRILKYNDAHISNPHSQERIDSYLAKKIKDLNELLKSFRERLPIYGHSAEDIAEMLDQLLFLPLPERQDIAAWLKTGTSAMQLVTGGARFKMAIGNLLIAGITGYDFLKAMNNNGDPLDHLAITTDERRYVTNNLTKLRALPEDERNMEIEKLSIEEQGEQLGYEGKKQHLNELILHCYEKGIQPDLYTNLYDEVWFPIYRPAPQEPDLFHVMFEHDA